MQLKEEEIKKIQKLMLEKYGKKLSKKEAIENATKLVLFVKIVIGE